LNSLNPPIFINELIPLSQNAIYVRDDALENIRLSGK